MSLIAVLVAVGLVAAVGIWRWSRRPPQPKLARRARRARRTALQPSKFVGAAEPARQRTHSKDNAFWRINPRRCRWPAARKPAATAAS